MKIIENVHPLELTQCEHGVCASCFKDLNKPFLDSKCPVCGLIFGTQDSICFGCNDKKHMAKIWKGMWSGPFIHQWHKICHPKFILSYHLYADDTIILKSASDPDSLISSLVRKLLNVDQWLRINKITVNTKKLRLFSLEISPIWQQNCQVP